MNSILETINVTYTYEGAKKPSLKNVSLQIHGGVKTAILGANGAGKSTFFYHLNGVCRPEDGEVRYNDAPISYKKKALRALCSHVAVVLQNPDDQIFGQTVVSDAEYGPTNLGLPEDEVHERARIALEQVGLWEFKDRNSLQLSYGQRKRLSLAGALAMRPDVLIMDEPTAGLDPQMALELMELAEQLHDAGTNIVISTHDVDLAYMWADEIHVLRRGEKIYSGDQETFYSNEDLAYSAGLLRPSMFQMNKSLAEMRGVDPSPYPRTEPQLIAKMASGRRGKLRIVPFDQETDLSSLDTGDDIVGIYGTDTRKAVWASEKKIDFVFGGFESCVSQVLLGKNATIICDSASMPTIKSKVESMSDFGEPIDCTFC